MMKYSVDMERKKEIPVTHIIDTISKKKGPKLILTDASNLSLYHRERHSSTAVA